MYLHITSQRSCARAWLEASRAIESSGEGYRIRDIRNDVMHFDPDGITAEERDDLRRFSDFLERLQRVTR